MFFGMDNEKIKGLGATYTATEIRQQPKLWGETYNIIKENEDKIKSFFGRRVQRSISRVDKLKYRQNNKN